MVSDLPNPHPHLRVLFQSRCLRRARHLVSLVDGFNIPMRVDNNKGCHVADCSVDLNPKCPAALRGPKDKSGKVAGCKSACVAGLGDAANNPNCCTGSHNTAKTCPPSGVAYYSYFSASPPLLPVLA